jgi:hypothetical protein
MSSVKPRRAPKGQSRLEFRSQKEKIAEVAKECPNLQEMWSRLKEEGVVTIGYSTFCYVYREVFPDEYAAMRAGRKHGEKSTPEPPAAKPQKPARKPLPAITGFKMPTGSDEVDKAW